ncbi:MAG: urea transporter [Bacteroidota bacterium]
MTDRKQNIFIRISPFLKGIGQIMLQNNTWTGLFFLAGIFYGSWMMGIAALLAAVTGTLTAKLLRYDETEINNGLYGFSAALVGVALVFYFQPTAFTWFAILLGSVLATMIQHFFISRKIPGFTFPFILVTWLFLFLSHYFPALIQSRLPVTGVPDTNSFSVLSLGFGQVIFQGSSLAGILFLLGVLISQPIAAIYGIIAAVISGFIAYRLGVPVKDIYMGLLSYNAVLCAITFAGNKLENGLLAFAAVVLSVLIMVQMSEMNLPALTFPFVLASWLVLFLQSQYKRVGKKDTRK